MSKYIKTITSYSEIGTLDKNSLISLFKTANEEAKQVQAALDIIAEKKEHVNMFIKEKEVKGKLSSGIITLLIVSSVILMSISTDNIGEWLDGIIIVLNINDEILITLIALLIIISIVSTPVWAYIIIKRNIRTKYDNMIRAASIKMFAAENTAALLMEKCKNLLLIPDDYRNPLALNSMMKYLMHGQADNWKECSLRYDEQLFRWKIAKNQLNDWDI